MTTKETNKLFDKFVYGHSEGLYKHYKDNNMWHDNWAWLMLAVETVEKTHTVRIEENVCTIMRFGSVYDVIVEKEADTKIEAVYQAIAYYIQTR
jgi:hypothetical protein